jgi:malonyl CoA-acyl carrier protein transacylase
MRAKIIEAIAAGRPYREITAWAKPAVTTMQLSRFKGRSVDTIIRHVTDAKVAIANNDKEIGSVESQAVMRAAMVTAADPFLRAAEKQSARRARWMDEIESAGDYTDAGPDYQTLAKLDANDMKGLELHARLAGRLDAPGANQTNVLIVCGEMPARPAPVSLDDGSDVIEIEMPRR